MQRKSKGLSSLLVFILPASESEKWGFVSVSEEILGFQGLFSLRDFKEGELFNFNGLKRRGKKKIRSNLSTFITC